MAFERKAEEEKRIRQEELRREEEHRREEEKQKQIEVERRKPLRRIKAIWITIAALALVSVIILLAFACTAEKRQLNREVKALRQAISQNSENGIYSRSNTVSGTKLVYSLTAYPSFYYANNTFDVFGAFEASVKSVSSDVELLGVLEFIYGDFETSASFYGKIAIKGNQYCYLQFHGVSCAKECPELLNPTEISVLEYSKSWDYSADPNQYAGAIWELIKAATTLTQETIHEWNDSLNLWISE